MVPLEIVQTDVPALLDLDILDLHQLIVDTSFDSLAKRVRLLSDDGSIVYTDK